MDYDGAADHVVHGEVADRDDQQAPPVRVDPHVPEVAAVPHRRAWSAVVRGGFRVEVAAGSLHSPVSWTWTPCSPGAAFWTSMSTTTPDALGVMRAVPEVLLPLRGSSTAVATGVAWAGAPA